MSSVMLSTCLNDGYVWRSIIYNSMVVSSFVTWWYIIVVFIGLLYIRTFTTRVRNDNISIG